MRATDVRQVPEAGDTGNLTLNDLSPTERLAYEAGMADARAQAWRIDADIDERDGKASAVSREYQRQYEAEAAELWRALAEAKGGRHA